MKLAAMLFVLIIHAAAQPAKRTASLIVRDAATGEAPKRFTATLVHEDGFTRVGMNARLVSGLYRIDGIAPGAYRLELGYLPIQGERAYQRVIEKNLTLIEGQALAIDVTMPPGGSFSGRVLDDGGQPVAHARVTVMFKGYSHGRLGYGAFSRLETDSLGFYKFEGLEPDRSYIVRGDHSVSTTESPADTFYPGVTAPDLAQEIVLKPGEWREGIDIQRRRLGTYCVDGTMEGFRGHVRGIEVVPVGAFSDMRTNTLNLAHADPPDGSFLVCGLTRGRYNFLAAGLSDHVLVSDAAGIVQVEGQDVHAVRLRPLSKVVFNAETAWEGQPSRQQAPVKVNVPFVGWRIGFTRPIADLAVPGKSAISVDLWPGDYDVLPVKFTGAKGVYVRDISWDGKHLSNGALNITSETKSCSIRVVLAADGSSLTAHTVDKAGAPVANAYVVIFPVDVATEGDMSERMVFGQADQNGEYTADVLPPGKYNVLATTDVVDSAANRIARLWQARMHAQEVQVGAKAIVDIKLVPDSSIEPVEVGSAYWPTFLRSRISGQKVWSRDIEPRWAFL